MKRFLHKQLTATVAALASASLAAIAHPGHDDYADVENAPAFFLAQAGPPPRGNFTTQSSARVTNMVTITTEGDYRVIKSNGWPDHAPGEFPRRGNPNVATPQSYTFRVPLKPQAAATPEQHGGWWWGVALNGVPFEPGTAENWNNDPQSGWHYEAATGFLNLGLDEHNAHVQPNGSYHYHALPVGMVERLGGEGKKMLHIGWAADGFPIYTSWAYSEADDVKSALRKLKSSYRLRQGARPSQAGGPGGNFDGRFTQDFEYVKASGDLDDCNGRFGVTPEFPQGTYYYCITADFPFIPRMWRGTPDQSFGKGGRPPVGGFAAAPVGGAPHGILEAGPGSAQDASSSPPMTTGAGGRGGPPSLPIVNALDLNGDGIIDAEEMAKAAQSLLKLDKNGDGKLSPDEYRPSFPGGGGGTPGGPPNAGPVPGPEIEPQLAGTSAAAVGNAQSPAALFDPKALVKPITEIEGILSDGSKATVYKIVVRSLPTDHAVGPWAPLTVKDKGGYWEDTVDKKLYRVDGDYLAMLNKRGWNMFDKDGTVHRTKDRTEFDKIARQELAGWTFEQAKKDGVTNSVIELQPLEQIVTIFLPKNPKASAQPTMLRQAHFSPRSGVGIGADGIRFFPPEPVGRITAFQNIAPLDPFGGHTGFGHEYHYHRAPAVMSDDKSGKIVGWALDGFPVRGPHEPNGSNPANLDAINGHDHDGLGYHFHATNMWPYLVGGFHGPLGTAALGDANVCDATEVSGGGPPGRGNQGNSGRNGPPNGGPPRGGPPGGNNHPPQ